jgi:hypothetical protein
MPTFRNRTRRLKRARSAEIPDPAFGFSTHAMSQSPDVLVPRPVNRKAVAADTLGNWNEAGHFE